MTASILKLKRSGEVGKAPLVGDLEFGEMAINFVDGKLFLKKQNPTTNVETIIALNDYQNIFNKPTKLSQFINDAGFAVQSASSVLKTFNILGEFQTLTGTARYYPAINDYIRSVRITVANPNTRSPMIIGLYKMGELLQVFTVPAGQPVSVTTNLEYSILTTEYYTVSVLGGGGIDLAMQLININL